MKTLIITLGLVAASAMEAWSQGYVTLSDASAATIFYTLGPGGVTNATGTTASSFYYDVLINASTVTTIDSSLQGLTAAGWSDSGITGVNGSGPLGAGRITPVNTSSSVWAPGVQQSFVVVGWSATLGSTWSQVEAQLVGARLLGSGGNSFWEGPSWVFGEGYLGYTTIGSAIAGSTSATAAALFASTSTAQVPVPVSTATELYPIVPEPGALSLAGLGVAALLIFRQKNLFGVTRL
jgi:hypothetical protein